MNLLSYLCTISSNSEVSPCPLLPPSLLRLPDEVIQVANIALRKPFLSLILHCIKTPLPTSRQTLQQQRVHSQSPPTGTTRSLAATLLALLIRYANYIDPPPAPSATSSSSDDQIIPVLTTLLKDPSLIRADPILRHKCIAALGELIFYISAQDDATIPGGANGRWIISNDVILVLTKSLSDDTDEIMRHYAAKVSSLSSSSPHPPPSAASDHRERVDPRGRWCSVTPRNC
jgi:hypothetical protein